MDTKERILLAALELFSRDGYEAVSVSMIAGTLNMTKGALYKHYKSKRDIFEQILLRMEERERANKGDFSLPDDLFEHMPARYKKTGLERLCAYTLAQFVYWTEDDFAARFRRMLSLERYRNREMNALYQRYLGAGPLHNVERCLQNLEELGLSAPGCGQLALEFYAPVYTLIGLFDGGGDARDIAASLKAHLERFIYRLDGYAWRQESVGEPALKYPRSQKYSGEKYLSMLTGPNPLKLMEELLLGHLIKNNALVCDLGSNGISSLFLAKEYGFRVYAANLGGKPAADINCFPEEGLDPSRVQSFRADAMALPFPNAFFDAVICVNAYHYFGRDKRYLAEKLLPYVKPGGYIYIAVPGMVKDCHERPPRELLLFWNPEQLDYLHDASYWRGIVSAAKGVDVLSVKEMESKAEAWQDWLLREHPYALRDRTAMEAGAGKYLNFIQIILRKR